MAAAEALIVLSLLGCDDSGTQCDFVRVGEERFETVEACRAASEPLLAASAEADYPTVVAVCSPESAVPTAQVAGSGDPVPVPVPPETPAEVDGNVELPAEGGEGVEAVEPPQPVLVEREPGLLGRVAEALSSLAPERETITKPIDVAADGAAKVGGAVIVGVKRVADAVNPF